jgi:glycosyltransferase involved in cell wall biosynthesis
MRSDSAHGRVPRRVTIGLPAYNRADLLRQAVESLQAQTHRDIEILVSDNCSPDPMVKATIAALANGDGRIRYLRKSVNEGAAANFRSVLSDVTTPYFMWASDDDLWDRYFVERCLDMLDSHPRAEMAFGSIDNIDLGGKVVRAYEGFSRFTSTQDQAADALRFVSEPEILGKANLIYGLFKTPAIQSVVASFWDVARMDRWAGDMVMMFAFISRYPIVVTDEVLLHKRLQPSSSGGPLFPDAGVYVLPLSQFFSFVRRLKAVAPDHATSSMVQKVMIRRLFLNWWAVSQRWDFWKSAAHAGARKARQLAERLRAR